METAPGGHQKRIQFGSETLALFEYKKTVVNKANAPHMHEYRKVGN